jgi:hypothetical protein
LQLATTSGRAHVEAVKLALTCWPPIVTSTVASLPQMSSFLIVIVPALAACDWVTVHPAPSPSKASSRDCTRPRGARCPCT